MKSWPVYGLGEPISARGEAEMVKSLKKRKRRRVNAGRYGDWSVVRLADKKHMALFKGEAEAKKFAAGLGEGLDVKARVKS